VTIEGIDFSDNTIKTTPKSIPIDYEIYLEPQLPYVYLPEELWPSFKTEFLNLYTEATGKSNPDREIHVEYF